MACARGRLSAARISRSRARRGWRSLRLRAFPSSVGHSAVQSLRGPGQGGVSLLPPPHRLGPAAGE
eukprot:8074457-Alexandrium_andersonii.AAC.1